VYIPEHFEITDTEEAYSFIEKNAFGQLVSNVGGRLFSTHMPFLLSADRTTIVGHLAAKNPQHLELEGQEVLVSLQGAHDYISPSWFTSRGVPTWNYQAVHIYGRGTVFSKPDKLKNVVETLTQKYESELERPWQPDYKNAMLGAIIGVEILIEEIQCKYKLSQNRPSQDQAQVIDKLRSLGSDQLADAMQRKK